MKFFRDASLALALGLVLVIVGQPSNAATAPSEPSWQEKRTERIERDLFRVEAIHQRLVLDGSSAGFPVSEELAAARVTAFAELRGWYQAILDSRLAERTLDDQFSRLESKLRKLTRELRLELRDLSTRKPSAAPHRQDGVQQLGTGSISGTVTDAVTSAPIGSVSVEIYDSNGYWEDYDYTDSGGNYSVTNLDPGTYYARTDNWDTYLNELWDNIPCYDSCDETTGTPIVVGSANIPGVDFALDLGGWISGRVTDALSGDPLSDGDLIVCDSNGYNCDYLYPNSNGDYGTGPGLAPGVHYARAIYFADHIPQLYSGLPCTDNYCDMTAGTPINVSIATGTSGIDFSMVRGGRISGSVNEEGSATPVALMIVEVEGDNGIRISTRSAADGSYLTPAELETGTYRAAVGQRVPYLGEVYEELPCHDYYCNNPSGTPVSVVTGVETTDIDFTLARGASVAGKVTDAETGAGIYNVHLRVLDTATGYSEYVHSNYAGDYSFDPVLPAADYSVTASPHSIDPFEWESERYPDLSCEGTCDQPRGLQVSVPTGGVVSGIDFQLFQVGHDPDLVLEQETLNRWNGEYEACRSVTLGPDLRVDSDSVVRAGEVVILGEGFEMVDSWDELIIEIDPTLTCP